MTAPSEEIVLPKVARNEEITILEYNHHYRGGYTKEGFTGFYLTQAQAAQVVEALNNCNLDENWRKGVTAADALKIFIGEGK